MDRIALILFMLGTITVIFALILKALTDMPQVELSIFSLSLFFAGFLLILVQSIRSGKKYAKGAKKRRKKYLPAVYGENSVFSRNSTLSE